MTAGVIAVACCRDCMQRVWLYRGGGRWVLADDDGLNAHWCRGRPHILHDPIQPKLLRGGAA